MKKTLLTSLICGIASVASATDYPLTIENCGHPQTFESKPASVVSIGQAATEILYALGQEDVMKGTAVWFMDVNEKYKAANDKVERLSDNTPSFEAVLKTP